MNKSLTIGLTGGIGSGKTTVSKIFKTLGIPVFNSDQHSKEILKTNTQVINDVVVKFGKSILNQNQVDSKKLAKIVFQNTKRLKLLNRIIHPHIISDFNKWSLEQTTKYVIKESAILFESNTHTTLNKIILIKAPVGLRIQRVFRRDKRSVSEIKKIINNQLKSQEISQYADYIINNNEQTLLTPHVIKIHDELSQL